MKKTICMFVTNSVANDPRVIREAATLAQAGFQVVVIGLAGADDALEEARDGFRIVRVTGPELYTVRTALALGLKRWFPPAYRMLRAVVRTAYAGREADREFRRGGPQPEQANAGPVSEGQAPLGAASFWKKVKTDILAIRYLFWVNINMARAARSQPADVFHAHDLDTLLAGWLAKRRTGCPLVYDFHELYTEQFQRGEKSFLWRAWYATLERILVKQADVKLTVCDSLGDWVAHRYGVSQATTVMNVPNTAPLQAIRMGEPGKRIVLFHGGYMPDRGLEGLISAARYVRGGAIVLRGYGPLETKLRTLVKTNGLEKYVSFAPPVPMAELVNAAATADIGVIPYLPVCLNNQFCLPNKIFEYLMAGLAVVGGDLPELRRIILTHHVGRVYDPYDAMDLARVLNELLADPAELEKVRRNALRVSQETLNWSNEGQKLLRLYDQVLGVVRS
jgi:glycogen(starch) synthase